MIYRIFNSFFIGFVFVSLLDFLYFIGIKLNYFDFYKITEYFNVIFVDNQNFILVFLSCFIVGYLTLYSKFSKLFTRIYIITIFLAASSIYAPIGRYFGASEFMQKEQTFILGNIKFQGNILYKGRKYSYIYRNDLSKTIKLSNDELNINK